MANLKRDAGPWCPIDLDPGTLTQLCKGLGISGVQIEQRTTLDENSFDDISPLYGVIFLYKAKQDKSHRIGEEANAENVFFAHQVVNDACATQALLSVVLNCDQTIDVGAELRRLKEFTKDFLPLLRGVTIVHSDKLREVHNSFARPHRKILGLDPPTPSKSLLKPDVAVDPVEDNGDRYVSFVHVNGYMWELDGLKKSPVRLRPCTVETWRDVVRMEVLKRREAYGDTGPDSKVMIVTQDRKMSLDRQLRQQEFIKSEIEKRLEELDPSWRQRMNVAKWEEEQKFAYDQFVRDRQKRLSALTPSVSVLSSVPPLPPPPLPPTESGDESPNLLDGELAKDPIVQRDLAAIHGEERFSVLEGWWLEVLDRGGQLRTARIEDEENKVESAQRRHDYMPFITEFLKRVVLLGEHELRLPESPKEGEHQPPGSEVGDRPT